MDKLLTIIIPTYQRNTCLERLLKMIEHTKEKKFLHLIVQNNDKNDSKTVNLLSRFSDKFPQWEFTTNKKNMGSDGNIVSAMKKVMTKYCWVIGDDDLPMKGLIDSVINCILQNELSLIYLKPFWTKNIGLFIDKKMDSSFIKTNAINLSSEIHIMTSFLSSWVFNIKEFQEYDPKFRKTTSKIGNQIIQLSWILPLLDKNGMCFKTNSTVILATSENTNSYAVLETFLYLLPNTIHEISKKRAIKNSIINNYCKFYLPKLIFSVRSGFFPKNADQKSLKISKYLKKSIAFQLFCIPSIILSNLIPPSFIKTIFLIIKQLKIYLFKLKKEF